MDAERSSADLCLVHLIAPRPQDGTGPAAKSSINICAWENQPNLYKQEL